MDRDTFRYPKRSVTELKKNKNCITNCACEGTRHSEQQRGYFMCFYYFLNNPVVTAHTKDVHYGFICIFFLSYKKMGGEFKHLLTTISKCIYYSTAIQNKNGLT